MKTPEKHPQDGAQRASGLVNISRCCETGSPRENMGVSHPSIFPHTLLYASLPSGCCILCNKLYCILYIKLNCILFNK